MADTTLICRGQMVVVATQKNSVVVSGNFKFSTRGAAFVMLRSWIPDPVKLAAELQSFIDSLGKVDQNSLFEGME